MPDDEPVTTQSINFGKYVKLKLGGVRPRVVIAGVTMSIPTAMLLVAGYLYITGGLPAIAGGEAKLAETNAAALASHAAQPMHAGTRAVVAEIKSDIREIKTEERASRKLADERHKETQKKLDLLLERALR